MKKSILRFAVFPLILLLCLVINCKKQAEEKAEAEGVVQEDAQLAEIPQVVMDALKAKFPEAEIQKWAEEKEGDIVLYDIEFKLQDQNFEADIKEDGSIYNWERAIAAEDLPDAVRQAAEKMYPNAVLKEIMMITAVVDGQDTLEGYEIVLQTADDKEVEITVAPDGTILEDSGKD
ncbi:MAG: hypothetical protein OEW18_00815 [Candidatus Aminicenantes bacterium]|nr:hypothetical protein [Candidatus Aminicenantes bacterium]